jgi:hypothetical protein
MARCAEPPARDAGGLGLRSAKGPASERDAQDFGSYCGLNSTRMSHALTLPAQRTARTQPSTAPALFDSVVLTGDVVKGGT